MTSFRFKFCPCCDSSNFAIWWHNSSPESLKNWKDFFYGGKRFIKDIISCRSCGYRFINTIPPHSEKWYSEQDIDVYRRMENYRARYFEEVKSGIINKFKPKFPVGALALDIACGDGLWLGLWRSHMRLLGTEASDDFKEVLANKEISILSNEDLQPEQYDLVSMFDFLEHIEDPVSFLMHKWSLVKPGGLLIIGVPDMGKIAALILGPRYYLVCPMHYSHFDLCSLDKLLNKTCPNGGKYIYPSPSLKTDLFGMLKWLSIQQYMPKTINFKLPLGYRPSIIAVVIKETVPT